MATKKSLKAFGRSSEFAVLAWVTGFQRKKLRTCLGPCATYDDEDDWGGPR